MKFCIIFALALALALPVRAAQVDRSNVPLIVTKSGKLRHRRSDYGGHHYKPQRGVRQAAPKTKPMAPVIPWQGWA